jgi:hypothetical protein
MATLIDSYTETGGGGYGSIYGTYIFGQTFLMPSSAYKITSAKFAAFMYSGGDGYASAEIYATTGTYGTTMVGTGSALAVSDSLYIIGNSLHWVEFTFSGNNQMKLNANTAYVIAMKYDSGSQMGVRSESTVKSHAGNQVRKTISNGTWTSYSTGADMPFYVYGDEILASNIKVYNGSGWDLKPIKIYNGTSWVAATLKRYNGTSWITE